MVNGWFPSSFLECETCSLHLLKDPLIVLYPVSNKFPLTDKLIIRTHLACVAGVNWEGMKKRQKARVNKSNMV